MSEKNQSSVEETKKIVHLQKSSTASVIYDWAHSLVFALAVVLILLTFFVRLVDVKGDSMNNTLYTGDKVIVTNFFYQPKTNDIVVISHGVDYDEPIIKRVIATEGQTLSIDFDNGIIKVDGKVIDQPYAIGYTYQKDAEIPKVIPKGKVFVLGDNRTVSADSRDTKIGLIEEDDIIGKAQVVVFPFNRFEYLG